MSSPIIINVLGSRNVGKTTFINKLILGSNSTTDIQLQNLVCPVVSCYTCTRGGKIFMVNEINDSPSYLPGFGKEFFLNSSIFIILTDPSNEMDEIYKNKIRSEILQVSGSSNNKVSIINLNTKSDLRMLDNLDEYNIDRNKDISYIWDMIMKKI